MNLDEIYEKVDVLSFENTWVQPQFHSFLGFCVVFIFYLSFSVSHVQCRLCLWIVHSWLPFDSL
jgi:hypothetical protein